MLLKFCDMKKLSTLLGVFLAISTVDNATAADLRHGYSNSFIFQEGAIEFAVFPDGQFDFNYVNQISQVNFRVNRPNARFSFNSGFNYNRFVQYDTFGSVIQIENTPIFYDSFGRIIQAGNISINYNHGFINRVGNLNVSYSRPGIIFRTSGFINSFNRFYVYRPWHSFYDVPFANNCIVWNTPYRMIYNPVRYNWAYHNLNWNRPFYYNGRFNDLNNHRNFYRPNDNVVFQSFERCRRDIQGRIVADRRVASQRADIATGRREVSRNRSSYTAAGRTITNRTLNSATSRSTARDATSNRNTNRATTANSNAITSNVPERSNATSNSRLAAINNSATVDSRTSRSSAAIARSAQASRVTEAARTATGVITAPLASRTTEVVTPQRTQRNVQISTTQSNERSTPQATAPRHNSRESSARRTPSTTSTLSRSSGRSTNGRGQ
jgi:hypothetical protein